MFYKRGSSENQTGTDRALLRGSFYFIFSSAQSHYACRFFVCLAGLPSAPRMALCPTGPSSSHCPGLPWIPQTTDAPYISPLKTLLFCLLSWLLPYIWLDTDTSHPSPDGSQGHILALVLNISGDMGGGVPFKEALWCHSFIPVS